MIVESVDNGNDIVDKEQTGLNVLTMPLIILFVIKQLIVNSLSQTQHPH